MTIDEAYRFINYVANKEQRGVIKPSNFNLLIPNSEIEFISKRLGNVKTLNDRALPQFGYKVNRKLMEDIRTLLVQSNQVINSEGYVIYPSDFLYLDSIYKEDFTEIKLLASDEYPRIKKSSITPPTADYPVAVPYSDRMLVDPLASTPFNTNPDFDNGLTGWTQIQNIQTVFQFDALNLWIDSGQSIWPLIKNGQTPPGYTNIPWITGAEPKFDFTGDFSASTILTTDYIFDGVIPTDMFLYLVYSTVIPVGLFNNEQFEVKAGFMKDGEFVPGQVYTFSLFPTSDGSNLNNSLATAFSFPISGSFQFDKFGVSVLTDVSGISPFTFELNQLYLQIQNVSFKEWLVSGYGYLYYLAAIGSNSSYLLYQNITAGTTRDVSVEFSLRYQGTVYVEIYELDASQNPLNITTVTVVSNNAETAVSQTITVSESCEGIGIITRTTDNIGGELKLYNLSFETPTSCIFNYIKKPATPYWAYTEDGDGNPVYDAANSVQLSTPPHTHVEICMIALQSIGINLDAAQITQYANMRESTMG